MRYIIKINRFGLDEIVGIYSTKAQAYGRFKALKLYHGEKVRLRVILEKFY